jgi:hypothetical protein
VGELLLSLSAVQVIIINIVKEEVEATIRRRMTSINLAQLACDGKLTVKEVNRATKERLEEDKTSLGYTVLYFASVYCPIEVVEAIVDKKVIVDVRSGPVSILVVTYYGVNQ